MKVTPALAKAKEKMAPGVITRDGFLGDDARPIPDIIAADEEMMASLGLEWNIVAEKLRGIIESGKKGIGSEVVIDSEWTICVDESRGKLPCPFGDGLHAKHTATLFHKTSGRHILLSELSLHLLSAHHFLEGNGSQFRIEPVVLKEITIG
jgi:hypothetical protein